MKRHEESRDSKKTPKSTVQKKLKLKVTVAMMKDGK